MKSKDGRQISNVDGRVVKAHRFGTYQEAVEAMLSMDHYCTPDDVEGVSPGMEVFPLRSAEDGTPTGEFMVYEVMPEASDDGA